MFNLYGKNKNRTKNSDISKTNNLSCEVILVLTKQNGPTYYLLAFGLYMNLCNKQKKKYPSPQSFKQASCQREKRCKMAKKTPWKLKKTKLKSKEFRQSAKI